MSSSFRYCPIAKERRVDQQKMTAYRKIFYQRPGITATIRLEKIAAISICLNVIPSIIDLRLPLKITNILFLCDFQVVAKEPHPN
jgi:hypothetical protein